MPIEPEVKSTQGICSKLEWIKDRILQLNRAITDYQKIGREPYQEWFDELYEHLDWFEQNQGLTYRTLLTEII